jgi:translation initiation factor IF-2
MAEQEIGEVVHYYDKIQVAAIHLTKGTLKAGETIRIVGHGNDVQQMVASMQVEHEAVAEAKSGDDIGIKVDGPVHEHDKVFKVEG